ncbi:hypothetical protein Cgig2_019486 [Carnegiea gigantea]|uniref:Cyclic nucleotide-binding domain-containing protein n=1 Tax=Carnegiea gigantea TaxID=171969 RepID=A0A9Q1QM92_9CARY|nr:hypothetical protein Cgig2_019486 [Carnegiea gigantea]
MDDRLLDAVCERLKPTLCTEGTPLVSEGDPLTEMLFVVRGYLYSCTTGGGRIVKAITDVEAFTREANDLKFAALQFRRLHSRELKHTLRCYSHQWRLWAACYIQAAWHRHKKRNMLGELAEKESQPLLIPRSSAYEEMEVFVPRPGSGMAVYAARLMADIQRGSSNRVARRVANGPGFEFSLLPPKAFYPVDWLRIHKLFKKPKSKSQIRRTREKALQLVEESCGNEEKRENCQVLSNDCDMLIWNYGIIDPTGPIASRWSKLFLAACIISLFIEPFFLLVPEVRSEFCIASGVSLQVKLTIIRSVTDLFYLIHIFVQFRTAYVDSCSHAFGEGQLVLDPWKIALRYLRFSFWVDLAVALPLPQLLLRLVLAYPLPTQIVEATGVISRKPWVTDACNLLFIMLSSHMSFRILLVSSSCLTTARMLENQNSTICDYEFCDCGMIPGEDRNAWIQSSNIATNCQPSLIDPPFTSAAFWYKFRCSIWWGFQNVRYETVFSMIGQKLMVLCFAHSILCSFNCHIHGTLVPNLVTSIYIGENWFSMMVVTLGLINYALYIHSATARLDEWTVHRNDTEQWMHHRQLPQDLRECIRDDDQYNWVTTRGVDEESLLKEFPPDFRRQIKRHLCLGLVRRVNHIVTPPYLFYERLKPTLCTEGILLVSEGDPLTEMLFVVRGHLYSCTTGGGCIGFFSSTEISPGDFCGEELLMWALEPPSNGSLPSSTWTVKAITDVQAFTLEADFRRLHSRELKHTLRCYSHQWRLWAARHIQAAWHRHKKSKMLGELAEKESQPSLIPSSSAYEDMEVFAPRPGSGMAAYATRLMADIRRGSSNRYSKHSDRPVPIAFQVPGCGRGRINDLENIAAP